MKKITLYIAVLLVVLLGGYIVYEKFYNNNAVPIINNQSSENSPSPSAVQGNQTPNSKAAYKDGQYTGDVVDAFYGPVQVKAIISGGKITDVQFLQYPNKPGHTIELSNQVMPVLISEAIKVQSAKVDIISGATQTTEGFIQSLSSALSKAS